MPVERQGISRFCRRGALIAAVLVWLAAGAGAAAQTLFLLPTGLQIGSWMSPYGTPVTLNQLRDAIEKSNTGNRIPALSDALNPAIIDPAKAEAFLARLAVLGQGGEVARTDARLVLNHGALLLSAAAPTDPVAFAAMKAVYVEEEIGGLLRARAAVRVNCTAAREKAARARTATGLHDAAAQGIKSREGQVFQPAQKAALLQDKAEQEAARHMAALTWRLNAEIRAGCARGEEGAVTDMAAARKAVAAFAAPPVSGMPPGR